VGAVTRKRESSGEQIVSMWGSNKYGQLGLCDYEDHNEPSEVPKIASEGNSIKISCGDKFTIIQVNENSLYSCGSNLQN